MRLKEISTSMCNLHEIPNKKHCSLKQFSSTIERIEEVYKKQWSDNLLDICFSVIAMLFPLSTVCMDVIFFSLSACLLISTFSFT